MLIRLVCKRRVSLLTERAITLSFNFNELDTRISRHLEITRFMRQDSKLNQRTFRADLWQAITCQLAGCILILRSSDVQFQSVSEGTDTQRLYGVIV